MARKTTTKTETAFTPEPSDATHVEADYEIVDDSVGPLTVVGAVISTSASNDGHVAAAEAIFSAKPKRTRTIKVPLTAQQVTEYAAAVSGLSTMAWNIGVHEDKVQELRSALAHAIDELNRAKRESRTATEQVADDAKLLPASRRGGKAQG